MKRYFVQKVIVLFLISMSVSPVKSQSISDVANSMLGKPISLNFKEMIKTDFGSFVFKVKERKGYAGMVVVKLTNGQYNYDSIVGSVKDAEIKVGSTWTDLIFTYIPVESKTFKTFDEAKAYYNTIDTTRFEVYNQLHIYKDQKKEKYLVGVFNFSMPVNAEMRQFDAGGKKLDADYVIIE